MSTSSPSPSRPGIFRWLFAGGLGVWWLVMALGCNTPTTATAGCSEDSDCPTGRCLAGLCVDPATDAQVGDVPGLADLSQPSDTASDLAETAADLAEAGTTVTCTKDADCQALLGPCAVPACVQGECAAVPLASGSTCTAVDESGCTTAGTCKLTECTVLATAKKCDDGEQCTADTCTPSGCKHLPVPDQVQCEPFEPDCHGAACSEGKCTSFILDKHCYIDGACYGVGAKTGCSFCIPSTTQTGWTTVFSGPCDDDDACTEDDECGELGTCSGTAVACPDDGPCREPACDGKTGCTTVDVAGPCVDGDPCTLAESCVGGECKPGTIEGCDDGNPCTLDECKAGVGCAYVPVDPVPCLADTDPCTQDLCIGGVCQGIPLASVCKIGGTCVPAGGKADGSPCLVCIPSENPNGWTPLTGADCTDGDACTFLDKCNKGQCQGELGVCDDKNPCTSNACDPLKSCVFTPKAGPCDDLSLCTEADQCLAGKCVGTPLSSEACADGNPCTDDSCVPSVGCTHTPNTVPCSDGDTCTKGDTCNAAKCVGGAVVCPCETDGDCNDGNVCTGDSCAPGVGCANVQLGENTGCNDGDACTQGDHCQSGLCLGKAIACNDGNPCTLDGCVAEKGCTIQPLQGIACSDSSACTTGDLCLNGTCAGTAKNCDDGNPCTIDACTAATGACTHPASADGTPCPEDTIACTIDQCKAGVCDHAAVLPSMCLIAGSCLSGGAVDLSDPCLGCLPLKSQTAWSPRTGLACTDQNACTIAEVCDAANKCAGQPLVCDDKNPCTVNACNALAPGQPCFFVAGDGKCDDGNACSGSDTCIDGTCQGKTIACNDGNPCTIDACQAESGCTTTPATGPCADDGLPCTADYCQGGTCAHPIAPSACVIAETCLGAGASGSNPCLVCAPVASQTSWTPAANKACDDGNPCTDKDVCTTGQCAGTAGLVCDDGDPCTTDSCNVVTGCSHSPATGPACDDGSECTVGEACITGKCVGGKPKTCTTSATGVANCMTALCDPTSGCIEVSTCGALHQCIGGACLTVSQPGTAGPAQVPLDAGEVPQPLVPSLHWQESHTGWKGEIPQLWVAAQTRACAPTLGAYSGLVVAAMPPGAAQPLVKLVAPAPGGGPACAVHPQFVAHGATYDHLVMTWLEGGNAASACAIEQAGGRARVALVGLQGSDLTLAAAAPCPTGSKPLPVRPAVDLLPIVGGNPANPLDLAGLLVRPSSQGLLAWQGAWQTSWGGGGQALPQSGLNGWTTKPASVRAVVSPWASGSALLGLAQFTKGNEVLPGVELIKISPDGVPASSAKPVAWGVDVVADSAAYHAAEVAWDPDSVRIGLAISGTLVQGSLKRGFLAFLRTTPEQNQPIKPSIVQIYDLPPGAVGSPVVHAFRVAEVPGSPDFLLLWAQPGTPSLQLMRLKPVDDKQFVVKSVATIATTFTGHGSGEEVADSGGLSEVRISPGGQRYSVAFEGLGSLYVMTGLIPN